MRLRVASLWWLPAAAAAAAQAVLARNAELVDAPLFIERAGVLISSSWAETFSDPVLQAGPLQLMLLGLGDRLAGPLGISSGLAVGLLVELLLLAALLGVASLILRDRPGRRAVLAGVGLAAVGLGTVSLEALSGHVAQMLVPLLWILAGLLAREGRALPAGLLVGLAAGFEVWGVLGIASVLLAPGRRRILLGTSCAVATAALLYAPFVLGGDFGMLEYDWRVSDGTLAALVLGSGEAFTWPMRVAQAAFAVAVGAVLARRLRQALQSVWIVPIAVVGVRLLLDPAHYPWYWTALQVLTLVGAADLLTGDLVRGTLQRRRALASR